MVSRKNFNQTIPFLMLKLENGHKSGVAFFLVSSLLHGMLLLGMVFSQNFRLPKPMPSVIKIDLVSFSPTPVIEDNSLLSDDEKISEEIQGVPTKVKPIKKLTKPESKNSDISLKKKPRNLKELMVKKNEKPKRKEEKKPVEKPVPKKEATAEKVPEKESQQAVTQKDQDKQRIAEALSRLQKKVKEQDKIIRGAGEGQGGGYGKTIELYKRLIGDTVGQNWVFNEILAKMDQNLKVQVLIKILQSGEIRDIIYIDRSGNRYLDESAKRALRKSNPLPALPMGQKFFDVILIFTPKGLN